MDKKGIIFKCGCYSHGIEITKDDEMNEYYLEHWYMGHHKCSLWNRIKDAWKIIKNDSIVAEEIIIDGKEYDNFIEYVKESK
jgi:hypothetical protein